MKQSNLFQSSKEIIKSEKARKLKEEMKNSEHSRASLCADIVNENYLWDMRCWQKLKAEYTIPEIIIQIKKWIDDDEKGIWSSNCGHTIYCIKKLLEYKWATLEEIAKLFLKNTNIEYSDEINTWDD